MRAVVLHHGQLVLDEVADPVPAPGQLLVRTLTNGICGSDLHSLERAQATPEAMESTVLGHEFCAEILDYGPATTERPFAIGSRVCANPFTAAGRLVDPGGLAEMMVLDVDRAVGVPEHVAADQAALTEPLAVGIRAVAVGDSLPGGEPCIVNGCGPIGLAVIIALQALGRGPIIATDLSPIRLAVAEKLGVALAINAGQDSAFDHLSEFGFTPAKISALLGPGAPDRLGVTIYECSGAPGMMGRLMEAAPAHSSIVVAGIPMAPESIAAISGIRRELTIGYALAYRPEEVALSLQRIAEGKVDTSALVTAIVPLAETPWAFEALRQTEQVKILIEPGR
jgi:threonine dehydrogenase-like Zn-dependent dehydrogenase